MFIYSEITGFYGSGRNESFIYTAKDTRTGLTWYCIDDSVNVNATYEDVTDGVNVEELSDVDCFTWSEGIASLAQFQEAVDY